MLSEGGALTPGQYEPVGDAKHSAPSGLAGSLLERPRQELHSLRERVGRNLLARFNAQRGGAVIAAAEVPKRIHRVADQTQLWTELLEDYSLGRYRDISWSAIAAIAGALLYAVNPADLLPDVIPFVGAIDDVALAGFVAAFVPDDMVRYCRFKGYDTSKYFAAN